MCKIVHKMYSNSLEIPISICTCVLLYIFAPITSKIISLNFYTISHTNIQISNSLYIYIIIYTIDIHTSHFDFLRILNFKILDILNI